MGPTAASPRPMATRSKPLLMPSELLIPTPVSPAPPAPTSSPGEQVAFPTSRERGPPASRGRPLTVSVRLLAGSNIERGNGQQLGSRVARDEQGAEREACWLVDGSFAF